MDVDKAKAPARAATQLQKPSATRTNDIIAQGWTFENPGTYVSSKTIKEFTDRLFITRRTKIEEFLKNSSRTHVEKSPEIGLSGAGANPPMGTPIGGFAPMKGSSFAGSLLERPFSFEGVTDPDLPQISNFDDFQSMVDARPAKDSLLVGFDTEWDGSQTLSWQFACILGSYIHEMVFISLDGRNLELDYCLGRIFDHLGMPSVDLRRIRRYDYCGSFVDGKPVVTTTDRLEEARSGAVYLYRDGSFAEERIIDNPERFLSRDERDWAWFHSWYDYSKCGKIPVTLVCHAGRVDIRNFGDDGGEFLFRFCSNVQGGLVTLGLPIIRRPRSLMNGRSHAERVYPLALSIRDTMGHAPAGMKTLEALGDVVGVAKVDLDEGTKGHMAGLWNDNPAFFLHYASRDSVVTMLYASALYGYNKVMPVTLTSAAAVVARKVMMGYLGCASKEEFNLIYRGLKKVSHGLTPRIDRPGYIESSSLEPVSDMANTLQYYCSQAFHGGYNGSSLIGLFSDRITYDYDLQNAYPSANSMVPDVDWAHPIRFEVVNRPLRLQDFLLDPFSGRINSLPFFVMYGTFTFPESVKFPCLPVTVDGIPIYPRTSQGLNGVYLMGPEVVLALLLGAEVFCERGYFINPRLLEGGGVSYSLRAVNKQLVSDRARAKAAFGKGCLEEQALKTMDNSIYGKNAQNVVCKSTWSAYSQTMEDLGASSITNPVSAAMTTSIVRAELLAVQNQCTASCYNCYSVTTDGGLFDCPEEVMKSYDLYGLKDFMTVSRLFLTDGKDPEIWEVKHAQDDLLNFCRRGNTSLYSKDRPFRAPNGKDYPGVNAHNSTKSGYPSDSSEDRLWLRTQVLTRTKAVRYYVDEWTTFKDQSKGKPFVVKKDVAKDVRMDFDFSRKPDRTSFYPAYEDLEGGTFEMACFDTVPFETVDEFRLYRSKKSLVSVLRTMGDWEAFWQKIDLRSSGAKPRDIDFSIIMSVVMGYRSGKFKIPKLDECSTVADKIEYINRHNSSRRPFKLNNWKDARKASRQSNMLPDEYLEDKLLEFINDD